MTKLNIMLVIVFAAMVIVFTAEAAAAYVCNGPENQQASAKCITFITGGEVKEPTDECCKAYKAYVETAKTREERRQLCACTQEHDGRLPENDLTRVDSLQNKCGLPFIFSAKSNFDCNTVN